MQRHRRRVLRAALAGACASAGATGARAQQYPDKPIRLVIPYPPGTGTLSTIRTGIWTDSRARPT